MRCGFRRKRRHVEPGRELFDGLKVLAPVRGFLSVYIPASERLALLRRRRIGLVHEIVGDTRLVYKELVPTPADRGNQLAIAERDDLYLMHPSGNATALGSHTAWLRLLTKTVERAILKRPYVHVGYTSIR